MQGVISFALQVVEDAILIVDGSGFLFANRSLEQLCGQTSERILQHPLSFMPADEYREFLVNDLRVAGTELFVADLPSESSVECIHQRAGPFLSKVKFHPYVAEQDSDSFKCVCTFSHPLFYKSIFDRPSSLLAIIEYRPAQRDCFLTRANTASKAFFALEHASDEAVRCRQLGVQLNAEDLSYLSSDGSSGLPHINQRLRVVHHDSTTSYLHATFTLIGCSLQRRCLFALVADDVTKQVSAETGAEDSRRQLDPQGAFFAKMVHELRSPLSGMIGMTVP
jgi:nitrogen-specific signal transduction histidine kinase